MIRIAMLFVLAISAAVALTPQADAQLKTGKITLNGSDPYACSSARNGSKFYPGMNCYDATISDCPGVDDIGITFGWTGPASPHGTIVFFSGASGEAPTENNDDIPAYAPVYVNTFQIVYVEYNGFPWEDPNNGAGAIF